MSDGVTYPINVVYGVKDRASGPLKTIATHAAMAARRQKDFSNALHAAKSPLESMGKHTAFAARKQRDFSSALHGTMARNRGDQIKRWFGSIRDGARGSASPVSGLTGAITGLAAGVGIFGALAIGKSAFIDFNSSVETVTISLATQEKMLLGGTWSSAMKNATGLFKDYQKVAAHSVGETKDYIAMHAGIASSAYKAGLGMQDLKEMTIGATVAAVALGERADMVALDVKQMLSGDVTTRDRTAQTLLASQGVSQSKFNAMNAKDRNKIIKAALNDPALKSAAAAYGGTFAGVTSTLRDNLSITMGKVGLPLFKKITAEVMRWNEWIEKNPKKIQEFASKFSKALVDGFTAVKDAMSWIVQNKNLLLRLAEAALVMKGASMAGGLLKSAAGAGIGGRLGSAALAAGGASLVGLDMWQSALIGASAALGPLGQAAAAAAIGLGYIASRIDKAQDRSMVLDADKSVLKANLARFGSASMASSMFGGAADTQAGNGARAAMRNARDMGMIGGDGAVDRTRVYQSLYGDRAASMLAKGSAGQTSEAEMIIRGLTDAMVELRRQALFLAPNFQLLAGAGRSIGQTFLGLGMAFGKTFGPLQPSDAKKKQGDDKDKLNVNVVMQITSDDPDRLAGDLKKAIRRSLGGSRRPARDVVREGA